MMIKFRIALKILFFVLILTSRLLSQNLVPNPSFEEDTLCPNGEGQLHYTLYWFDPSITLSGTPDYFNTCSSSFPPSISSPWAPQNPKSGNAYAGIFAHEETYPNFREYVEVALTSSLKPCTSYKFEMYISLNERSSFAMDQVGAYFTKGPVANLTVDTFLDFSPQVSSNVGEAVTESSGWAKVDGVFEAKGGEDHLIIGFFGNDASHIIMPVVPISSPFPPPRKYAYYYIDQVSLTKEETVAGEITIDYDSAKFCSEDFFTLSIDYTNEGIVWSTGEVDVNTITINESGTYWVQVENDSICKNTDTVNVKCNQQLAYYFPNVFSPNNDGENDVLKLEGEGIDDATLVIYDRFGKKLFETSDMHQGWDGSYKNTLLANDIYVYHLLVRSQHGTSEYKGNVTLIR